MSAQPNTVRKEMESQTEMSLPWEQSYPESADWHMPLEAKPLHTLMDDAVAKYGNCTAIDFLGKTYSYAEIGRMVDEVAYSLQQMGIGKGKKVGIMMPNAPYYSIFYFGILKAGGTVVNYNPLYADREVEKQIEDSDTDIMVTMDFKMMLDKMATMLKSTRMTKVVVCSMAAALPFPKNFLFPLLKGKDLGKIPADDSYIRFESMIGHGKKPADITVDAEKDIAVLQYTGGTTGVPKGAMLTHANLYINTAQTAAWIKDSVEPGKSSQMAVLPFFHVFAMTVIMNVSTYYGMNIILMPKFDIDEVLKTVDRKRPTYFPAVPAIYNAIANHPEIDKYDFSSIKFCLSGGAPLPDDVRNLFEEKVKNKCICEGYGLTECAPVATCNPLGRVKGGSVGVPIPGTMIEILDREDKKTILPIGEKGEVCISGPQVMRGYYKAEEATAETIREGRLHTGDVGYLDEEGYLFLVDRIKDLILVRGYNVYPRHVEEAVYLHEAVEECIVAGVPDKDRGETVWAWVKPKAGKNLTSDELLKFLEDKLSPIEMPRKIIVKSEPLPKTAVGKLSRKDLLIQEGIKEA